MERKGAQAKDAREENDEAAGPRFARTRRGLLGGLAGALGLFAGETILAAKPAKAANGDP